MMDGVSLKSLLLAGILVTALIITTIIVYTARHTSTSELVDDREPSLGAVVIEQSLCHVTIKEQSLVLEYFGHNVYSVDKVELQCSDPSPSAESVRQVKEYMDTAGFYYSPTGDISLHAACQFGSCSSTRRDHFVANQYLLHTLPDNKQFRPIRAMLGFIGSRCSNGVCAAIISRTATQRCSTRFMARGVDDSGHAATFIETELLITKNSHEILTVGQNTTAQFLILRGSHSPKWSQPKLEDNLSLPHIIVQSVDAHHQAAYEKHYKLLDMLYGDNRVWMLSLLENEDPKSRDYKLAKTLEELAGNSHKQQNLISFNYNKQVKQLKWKTLLADYVNTHCPLDFTLISEKGNIVKHQTAVIRVNCLDTLDRTSLAQSPLPSSLYPSMFTSVSALLPASLLDSLWVENADSISLHITGTLALKRDVAFGGRPDLSGKIRDSGITAKRYWNAFWLDPLKSKVMKTVYGPESAL